MKKKAKKARGKEEEIQNQSIANTEGFVLEVVLQNSNGGGFNQPSRSSVQCSLAPAVLSGGASDVGSQEVPSQVRGESVRAGGQVVDRDTSEAYHIIDIQEDLGMTFKGVGNEDVTRVKEFERRKIRELVQAEHLDFLALQETKMDVIPNNFVQRLWGNSDCGWVYLPVVGNSGGILSIWNKVKASLVFSFIGEGFVGVCLQFVGELRCCYIVNVYAKCNLRAKHRLWSDILMSKRGFGDGLWCVVGDFNSVRDCHERRGVGVRSVGGRSTEMVEFDNFLNDLELVDMPLIGRSFTWFHPNGVSMSRLDRVLISSSWFDVWGNPNVWVLARDVADHCPLVLRYSSLDWGPKPFRFNNFWLGNREFKEVITKAWESQHFEGWMGFILKERLKGLKGVIKEWSGRTFGEVEHTKK
ncbi:reverse transcriptase, partial [Trifolium medium]|nr:reverse transcriptase [Trifolium medium]